MDSQFEIPGTKVRFGWDAIIGLVPGIGDGLTALAGFYFVFRGIQEKLPSRVIFMMLFNILIEFLIGTFPIIGDAFDMFFKANIRNLELLRKYKTK